MKDIFVSIQEGECDPNLRLKDQLGPSFADFTEDSLFGLALLLRHVDCTTRDKYKTILVFGQSYFNDEILCNFVTLDCMIAKYCYNTNNTKRHNNQKSELTNSTVN